MGANSVNHFAPCAEVEGSTLIRRGAIHQQNGVGARWEPSPTLTRAECAAAWVEADDASTPAAWLSALDALDHPLSNWLDGLSTSEAAGVWAAAREAYAIAVEATS